MKTYERYEVRWYVPALNTWISVATARNEEQAIGSERFFRKSMKEYWKGELQVGIVRIVEEEV